MSENDNSNKHSGHLGAVYAATNPEEVAAKYDDWADTYDAHMAGTGYRHPSVCLALLARHLPSGEGPVLDAGAGTGLIGEWLPIVGYPHAEALDLSRGMLAVAERKGVYKALHRLALGGPLPFETASFAAIVSAGVFTTGHVGPEALDELTRILRPGGFMVITVKGTLWDGGFGARIAALETEGLLRLVEKTEPYVSMPGDVATLPGRCVVLQRLD